MDIDYHLNYFPPMKSINELEPRMVHRKRRITLEDAKGVAKLVATRRLTETEACMILDINPRQWASWKTVHKNLPAFSDIVTRMRAKKIDNLISDIEQIADGDESIRLKPDWRAKQFILQVTDKRFVMNSESSATENAAPPMLTDALRRAFAGPVIDIDTTNVSNDSNKDTMPIKALSAPARAIPPRKPKADSHPQPLDDCK